MLHALAGTAALRRSEPGFGPRLPAASAVTDIGPV